VENGTRGQVTRVGERGGLTVELDGSGRSVRLAGEDVDSLRLGYAQHVYRQQGATVERTVVVTGGWQTSNESAYVEATRARQGTDWFLAREELGSQGQDADRVMQLARRMGTSRAQTPSLAYEPYDPAFGPGYDLGPLRILRVPAILIRSSRNHDRSMVNRNVDRGR
jgi:hypothetical protein